MQQKMTCPGGCGIELIMSRGVFPPKFNKCLGGLLQSTSRGGLDKRGWKQVNYVLGAQNII